MSRNNSASRGTSPLIDTSNIHIGEGLARMKADMSSGLGQANLTLKYDHHKGDQKGGLRVKDYQVASAEFFGTFFLALLIAGSKKSLSPDLVPLAIGFGLVSLVYCTGPVSGGQLNPAVTLGLVMRNHISIFEACYCIVSQFLGAMLAGAVCYALYDSNWNSVAYPEVTNVGSHSDDNRWRAFVGEMLQTFALVTTVLNTATTKAQSNNSYFGIAIGFVVLAGALVMGQVSGACFNPAIGMLAAFQGDGPDMWVYLLGPSVGGILAGLLFRVLNPSEWDDNDPLAKLTESHHNPDGNLTRLASMLSMEFVGTFFVAYTVALTSKGNSVTAFIAPGAMLVSMVYAGGAISGSHFNPAVTVGVYLRGLVENPHLMRIWDCFFYIGVQLLGAFAGGSCAAYVAGGYENIASPAVNTGEYSFFEAVVAEFLYSSLLVLTVLSVATNKKVSGNSYFGVAIGFTIISGTVAVGAISGGCFNPAIGIALPSMASNQSDDVWVYVIGDMLGSAAAAALYVFWYSVEGDPNQKFVHARLAPEDEQRTFDNLSMKQGLLQDFEGGSV